MLSNTGRPSYRKIWPKPGRIVIVSSPSGGGKTSICRGLLTSHKVASGWRFSVSYTTRPPRRGEEDGREYFFVTPSEFSGLVEKDFFAEHFSVHLYDYGTPRGPVEKVINNGGVMLLDVDVQGAGRLKQVYDDAITIFIKPPSEDALRQRLQRRGTETKEQLRIRFENAREEMKMHSEFDFVVINDDLIRATKEVLSMIDRAVRTPEDH